MNGGNETIDNIASHYREILRLIGEDPEREGLKDTPQRAAKAIYFATSGYRNDTAKLINNAIFSHEGSQMVIVRDIEFYSLCEHHILPFFGHISIGYIPNGKIIGISKLARIAEHFARRLQVQERFTAEVCRELERVTGAKGVMAVCTAGHMCMKMRGVEKQDSTTVTTEYTGVFKTSAELRNEFLSCVRSDSNR